MRLRRILRLAAWAASLSSTAFAAGPDIGTAVGAGPGGIEVPDVPFLAQPPSLCGGAAVAMVLRYWGDPSARPEDFASALDADRRGIDSRRLPRLALGRGFEALVFSARPVEAATHLAQGRPLIVLLGTGESVHHYVVVLAWKNEQVLYHDPAEGPFQVMGEAEWLRRWEESDRWTLLLLPPAGHVVSAPARREPAPAAEGPCVPVVSAAVEAAEAGRWEEASAGLQTLSGPCASSPLVFRERAGLEFRGKRWKEAVRLSAAAVRGDPADSLSRRLLASSRYLEGDETGALRDWNAVGEPTVSLLRIEGLHRTPFARVQQYLGETAGGLLTPDRLRRLERRLALLPALRGIRVDYRPLRQGRADLEVAVLERRGPDLGRIVADVALGVVTDQSLGTDVQVVAPGGDTIRADGRWHPHRSRLAVDVASPGALGLPGVVTLGGSWDEQSYRASGASVREVRRGVSLGVDHWWTADLRAGMAVGMDDWQGRGRHLALRGGAERRTPGDRLAVAADVAGWWSPRALFGRGTLQASARTRRHRDDPYQLRLDVFHDQVSAEAPLGLWPAAGKGNDRGRLLRAHSLVDDGVVVGPALGRRLTGAVLEGERRVGRLGPWSLGLVGFVDAVHVASSLSGAARSFVDVGGGLRIRSGSRRRALRLDAAVPAGGGTWRVSGGWVAD